MSTLKPLLSDVAVLSTTDFSDLQTFRMAVQANPKPSLLLVDELSISHVLVWLSEKDDICLVDSPQPLIEHRAERLRRKAQPQLDSLTQVLARQPWDRVLRDTSLAAQRQKPVSLLLCDLDHFKRINDSFGHSVGDEAICAVAELLTNQCSHSLGIGRLGGALFAVLLECDAEKAMHFAERIRGNVKQIKQQAEVELTLSIGIASTVDAMEGDELLQQADQALYTAKANGRDCCVSFDEMQATSLASGNDVEVVGLENQARVLAERVANVITMKSRRLLTSARKEADIDGLTGCFNRRYLDRRLELEFECREEAPLSIAFLDLDHFGQVNKKFGWPTGDKILVEVCDTIRGSIRMTDWLGRYGGEEFCLVMPGASLEASCIALKRIRESIADAKYFSTCNQIVAMTVSIGAAEALTIDNNYTDLVDRASHCALLAKRNGRNQIQIASGSN